MREIDWYKVGIVVVIGLGCLSALQAWPQNTAVEANGGDSSPIRQRATLTESGIQPEALDLYWKAARELHQGHAVPAENDAARALQIHKTFADAAALEATAILVQQDFDRARAEAIRATDIDSSDEKAWVILATADNHLGKYSEAAEALRHVGQQDQETWQVSYQWARAEAGLQHLRQCVEWINRAALSAPPTFAPLHLLRASSLLAMGETAAAADELEIYLQLPSVNPTQRALLTKELNRLRKLPHTNAAVPSVAWSRTKSSVQAN